MEENKDLNPAGTQGGAPAGNPTPKSDAKPKKEGDPRVKDVLNALAAFPTLEEGYIIKRGIYFDKEVAESFLEEGEKLITVKRPAKK
ncbi:hypothetical protein [Rufibacter soli]